MTHPSRRVLVSPGPGVHRQPVRDGRSEGLSRAVEELEAVHAHERELDAAVGVPAEDLVRDARQRSSQRSIEREPVVSRRERRRAQRKIASVRSREHPQNVAFHHA